MPTQKTSGIPARTAAVFSALKAEIGKGRFREVDRLPGERDLARLFSVSRTTLRRAIDELKRSGLLYQRHGFGTYIRREPVIFPKGSSEAPQFLVDLTSVLGHMVYYEGSISTVDLERSISSASPAEGILFRLRAGEPIHRTRRLILVDGDPTAHEETFVPSRFIRDPQTGDPPPDQRMQAHGLRIATAKQRIRQTRFDEKTAEHLRQAEDTSGFSIERFLFLDDGSCCALRRLTCRGESFDCVQEIAIDDDQRAARFEHASGP